MMLILCTLSALALSLQSQAYGKYSAASQELTTQTSLAGQLSATELFSRLAARRTWQETQIKQLSAVREYEVKNNKGKKLAAESVLMDYIAPHTETFTTKSSTGSRYIRTHVFQKLMEFESSRVRLSKDRNSLITPQNYNLEVLGREPIAGSECLVVRAIARRNERDLFRGTIWVDEQDFAVVKILGDLAKSPSFWVKHVRFVREYQRLGEFWLPAREQAVSTVRVFGEETMTVDYHDYTINGRHSSASPQSGLSADNH